MKRSKKIYRYGVVGSLAVLFIFASGCACGKKQPVGEEMGTVEVVSPAPPREEAPMPPAIVEEPLEQQARSAGALQTIYFDFDKDNLTPAAVAKLDKTADWLKSHPEVTIIVEGNCDERGTNEYNMALGERRANSAKRYVVGLGISADQVSTISYGEERPVDPAQNEAAWAKNRRDDFKITK